MINICTVGTSFITEYMLDNIAEVPGITCQAVYSRSRTKGQALADKYDIPKIYTNYETMLHDKSIDWIYIASPNSLHYEHAKTALLAGKNVLCEKPFTATSGQLRELIQLAKNNHLFLFEAILPMFHPNFEMIKDKLISIGEPLMATGVFCQYSSRYEQLLNGETPNVFHPQFAGGALMDLNVYNLYFFVALFGRPINISYHASVHENGIDLNGILRLEYRRFTCECIAGKNCVCENSVQIMGEKGYIRVTPTASNCEEVKILRRNENEITFRVHQNPWYYEILGLVRLVSANDYKECYRRLDLALLVVELLEEARKSAGLNF